MEEVIGSIPIRSTNLAHLLGANFDVNFRSTPAPVLFPSAQLSGDHACLRRRSARLAKLPWIASAISATASGMTFWYTSVVVAMRECRIRP